MRALEPEFGAGQSSPVRLAVLGRILRAAASRSRAHVLEVGSYEGGSALAWRAAIEQHCSEGGSVTCVDPWRPYHTGAEIASGEHYRRMNEDLRSGAAYARFVRNVRGAETDAVPIFWHVGTLREKVPLLVPGVFSVVYLDGNHRYDAVHEDIALVVPLLREGGILCGDDLERQLDECSEAEARTNAAVDYFDNYHPGVTLAVGEAFGRVWAENGVWAVRKGAGGTWTKMEETV